MTTVPLKVDLKIIEDRLKAIEDWSRKTDDKINKLEVNTSIQNEKIETIDNKLEDYNSRINKIDWQQRNGIGQSIIYALVIAFLVYMILNMVYSYLIHEQQFKNDVIYSIHTTTPNPN